VCPWAFFPAAVSAYSPAEEELAYPWVEEELAYQSAAEAESV